MEFKTKDADEAAFYWSQKRIKFISTEIQRRRWKNSIWFVFDVDMGEDEFAALQTEYWNGNTLVEPREYARLRTEIKNIIKENIFKRPV